MFAKDIIKADLLLSNSIDDIDAYEWMMQAREIVNYRCASFLEPDSLEIWDKYAEYIDDGTIESLFENIINDEKYVYPFQEEYAIMAIPLKRFVQTTRDLDNCGLLALFDVSKSNYLQSIINNDERKVVAMKNISSKLLMNL